MKTKKYNIDSVEDVEELFQAFKKKLIKDFDNGVPSYGEAIKTSKWIQKKTGMSQFVSMQYAQTFLDQILKGID